MFLMLCVCYNAFWKHSSALGYSYFHDKYSTPDSIIFSILYIISHFTQTMPNNVLHIFLIDIQESLLVPRCLAWCITRQPFNVSIISQYTTPGEPTLTVSQDRGQHKYCIVKHYLTAFSIMTQNKRQVKQLLSIAEYISINNYQSSI